MATGQKDVYLKVQSDIGDVKKDASGLASEFKIMGVSLNDVKKGFTSMAATAKASFASIKAGIMSTGIGALVIAVGSLVTFFTNTKRGADQLSQAFTAMGAVVDVLTDRVSKVGEALSFVFSGEFRQAGNALKGVFSGITKEVKEEVAAMVELKKRTQELRDADMEFMVQKAATRQEIEKARLIAEDETKSAKERLENLKKALELEQETTQRELELARERMQIQKEEMALSENSAEDERRLAELKTQIIEKETASIKMRRRVVTEVNALEREINAEQKARAKERQDRADAELKSMQDLTDELELLRIKDDHNRELMKLQQEKRDKIAEQEKLLNRKLTTDEMAILDEIYTEKYLTLVDKAKTVEIKGNEAVVESSKVSLEQQLGAASHLAGAMSALAGDNKELAAASAIIDTFAGANKAFAQGGMLGFVTGAAIIAQGMANVNRIFSTDVGTGSGGSASAAGATEQPPSQTMVGGAFQLSGGQAPEPLKAFVVTDEMTNSQNQLANIRRRSTI